MKIHKVFLLFMSFFSSLLFGGSKSDSNTKDKWVVAQVNTSDGKTGIFRFLQTKPEGWKTVPLSEEVSISWKYDGVLPDNPTNKRMNELEDALDSLSVSKDSYLALVMTVYGLREWCFYTRDYDKFMKSLNSRLSGKPIFPISIDHSHDPEWKYWHSFTDKLEKKK